MATSARVSRRVLPVALAFAVLASSVGVAVAAPPSKPPQLPAVVWSPTPLNVTVARGETAIATSAFTPSKKLANVTIGVSGAISSLVTPSPASLKSAASGVPISVSLSVAVPGSAAIGDYVGSVAVLSGRKALADTLPITVHVVRGTGHIYWAASSQSSIGRADIDGSNADPQFIPLPPSGSTPASAVGAAVDNQYVYWTDANAGAIGRANLDGSNPDPTFIVLPRTPGSQTADLHIAYDVAVDANYIYWADGQAQSIGRATLDGSVVDLNLVPTGAQSLPSGVAVDANFIYWTDQVSGSIGRADLDGSNPDPSFMFNAGPGVGIVGVVVDATYIYWGYNPNQFAGAIGRANLDGSNPNGSFITATVTATGVEVDANYVYWANYGGSANLSGAIGRAQLDGSNPDQSFVPDAGNPYYLAVSGG